MELLTLCNSNCLPYRFGNETRAGSNAPLFAPPMPHPLLPLVSLVTCTESLPDVGNGEVAADGKRWNVSRRRDRHRCRFNAFSISANSRQRTALVGMEAYRYARDAP